MRDFGLQRNAFTPLEVGFVSVKGSFTDMLRSCYGQDQVLVLRNHAVRVSNHALRVSKPKHSDQATLSPQR